MHEVPQRQFFGSDSLGLASQRFPSAFEVAKPAAISRRWILARRVSFGMV